MLAGASASAQALELLGPAGIAPPEGFEIAVRASGVVEVTAHGASVRARGAAGPLRTWFVAPAPEVREIRVTARAGASSVTRTFEVGPPAARVEIALAGTRPVKGRDTDVGLDVRVLRADGTPDPDSSPPVLRANVGRIEVVERTGPGTFRARYHLPPTRFPEVAVIVAFAPWPHPNAIHGAFGSLLVPLASSIELPGYTEPDAEMSIEIAGTRYGPTRADGNGRFLLPVVVPPGHRFGKGVAIDPAGNRRVSRIDLMLPPTDQLACVMNPARLPADGEARARVICATSDPYGAPQASAKVRLSASSGALESPRVVAPGIQEWIYTAPEALPASAVKLEAEWRQGRAISREAFALELVQGPVASITFESEEPVVHYGGRVGLVVRARDVLSRPRGGIALEPRAPFGAFSAMEASAPGEFRFWWAPPATGEDSQVRLSARALGPLGADPARIVSWREGGEVRVGVVDLAGWPVPRQTLVVNEAGRIRELATAEDGTASLGALAPGESVVRHAQWPGLSLTVHRIDASTVWPEGTRPATAEAHIELVLAPPVEVNVRIRVEGRQVTYWAESTDGTLLPDRELVVSLQGAEGTKKTANEGRTSLVLEGGAPAVVSVADVETGVTALATVP